MAETNNVPQNEITIDDLKRGILCGFVRIGSHHYAINETVCFIGDNWFYFGGLDAELEKPFEYATNHDFDETLQEIAEVLEEFHETEPDEWLYYRYILNND